MLDIQSPSVCDALYLRKALGKRPASEFEEWLAGLGMLDPAGGVRPLDPTKSPLRALV